MPLYEPTMPARYAEVLLDRLQAMRPKLLRSVLAAAGIDEAMLSRERATLTVAQFDALLALLAQHSGRSDLGFEMGLAVKLEDHPALGVALRRCATADSLLRLLVRFSRLITPSFNLSYQRSVRQGEFIWRPAAPMSAATLHAVQEGVAVSLHTEIKAMLGERLRPCDIYLSMPAPPHRSRYRRLRPTRYHFSSQTLPEVRLVIGAELLDLPLTQPHLHADPVAESELEAQQRGIGRSARWSEWVSMMLREAEGCQPTRAQLAELLDVSEPTLVRYLAKEGHCLRDLGNRIRRERACALLRGSRQSITEIAYRLGYSDVANFSHAFRAASDLSPRAWRSMQTAEDSLDPQIVRGTNAPAPRKRKF